MGAKHLTIEEYAFLKTVTKYMPVEEIIQSGLTRRSASTLRSIKRSAHFADYERIIDGYVAARKEETSPRTDGAFITGDTILAAALMEYYQPIWVRRPRIGVAGQVEACFPSQAQKEADKYWAQQLKVEPQRFTHDFESLQKRAQENY